MRKNLVGRRAGGGFTLVELMIVVVILGILAAIAIPAFSRYVRKSKTAEATTNMAHILTGEVTAYQRFADSDVAHFISAGPTPLDPPTASKYPANAALWTSDPNWADLGFSLDTGHYYQYSAALSGGGPVLALLAIRSIEVPPPPSSGDGFSVQASGDLDGDGSTSAFTRNGTVNDGEIQVAPLDIVDELE